MEEGLGVSVLAPPSLCTVPPALRFPAELNSTRLILPVRTAVLTMHMSSLHPRHIPHQKKTKDESPS